MSLDALSSEVYEMITGVDTFEKAILGIKRAAEANLTLVGINTVLLKG